MNSIILENGYKAITINGLIGSFLVTLDCLVNRERIREFLDILEVFDEQVRYLIEYLH